MVLEEDVSYLIVGGLKGLCGTIATQLARHGAKHLVILSRSGCDDERSQAVLKNLKAIGCSFTLVTGDVAKKADVTRCFKEAPLPIGGIIQGAMVLRVKPPYHSNSCAFVKLINIKGPCLHLDDHQRVLPGN